VDLSGQLDDLHAQAAVIVTAENKASISQCRQEFWVHFIAMAMSLKNVCGHE